MKLPELRADHVFIVQGPDGQDEGAIYLEYQLQPDPAILNDWFTRRGGLAQQLGLPVVLLAVYLERGVRATFPERPSTAVAGIVSMVRKLQEAPLQLEAWIPLAYGSVGLAIASLLWALVHLMGHTVLSGSPADTLVRSGWQGSMLHASLKFAFLPSMLLGLLGALRDPDTRRAGLVGIGLSVLAIVTWAITGAIVRFLNPEGPL